MTDIEFNSFSCSEHSLKYLDQCIASGNTGGNGIFGKKCERYLRDGLYINSKVLLTTSCTHSLEMSSVLMNFKQDDEVIVPSYTFVSTALAFVMHGAKPVFADVREDTLNIDETKISSLITKNTRAIVVVHYAGVACEMDEILKIANKHDLVVIEDNAHGLFGKYKNKPLGAIGHLSTLSFHETKNISCGEGGALIVNDLSYYERSMIVREKGTNRQKFLQGEIDKYSWVDKGSSYVMSDVLAAILYGQLIDSYEIQKKRAEIWRYYFESLSSWADSLGVKLPFVPKHCEQAYHMFYLLLPAERDRARFIEHMNKNNIKVTTHYVPLHQSVMGREIITDNAFELSVTDNIASRVVRLPLYYSLSNDQIEKIVTCVQVFK